MKLESLLDKATQNKIKLNETKHRWDRKPMMLTIKKFQALHRVGANHCNNGAGLLELVEQHFEVNRIKTTICKGHYEIYVQFMGQSNPQGFENMVETEENFLFTYKEDGKKVTISMNSNEIEKNYIFQRLMGELFMKEHSSLDRDMRRLAQCFENKMFDEMQYNEIAKQLKLQDIELIDVFMYNKRISLNPDFVNVKGPKIELGEMSNHTYHSLPVVYTFDFLPNLKTVELRGLGVEKEGYYDGHSRHSVRADQVDEVVKFNKSFQAKIKKGINKAIKG